MNSDSPRDHIFEVIDDIVPKKVAEHLEVVEDGESDPSGLLNWVNTTFPLGLSSDKAALDTRSVEENGQWIGQLIKDAYGKKAALEHAEALMGLERYVILNAVDRLWQEHLYAMDGLREAVYLRAFAQKDPLVEYKTEAYSMFTELMDNIKLEVLNNLFRSTTNLQAFENLLRSMPQNLQHGEMPGEPRAPRPAQAGEESGGPEAPRIELPIKRDLPKVGRNEPCPCGSGKKFKACCGRTA
jgi:preprotein translocase subunit SecA